LLPEDDHQNYNCKVTTSSGNSKKVYANWIHNNKLDNWYGWECKAGVTRVLIDKDLSVYGGECKNNLLGNALTGFTLIKNFTICKQTRCSGCTDDLLISKHVR